MAKLAQTAEGGRAAHQRHCSPFHTARLYCVPAASQDGCLQLVDDNKLVEARSFGSSDGMMI